MAEAKRVGEAQDYVVDEETQDYINIDTCIW
jgi:hypothetical protein